MSNQGKPPGEADGDVERLRQRVAELEAAEHSWQQAYRELSQHVELSTSDLRIAEERLRESEARFRNIFEFSNDAILLIDPDLNEILDGNARACSLLHYTHSELLNVPPSVIFPDELARLQSFALSVAEQGHGWIDELTCQTRTGGRLDVEMSASEVELEKDRSCIIAAVRDITARKRAEKQLVASLNEKEILLKEIHHRVKNNLQIVSSLFDLQSARSRDDQVIQLLRECRNRVSSMSLIHETLYQSNDLARVDFGQYVTTLLAQLFKSYGVSTRLITLDIDVDEGLSLGIDTAIPTGLIVNELASNALKYAFESTQSGRLAITLGKGDANQVSLCVADDGRGFPADIDFGKTTTLGLRLVMSLVNQLRGTIALDRSAGTRFTCTFAQLR